MINGFEYSWEDINVTLLEKLMIGIEDIEYTTEKDHMNIYGRGDTPVAMGRGSKKFSGKITITQSEFEAIQQKLPTGKTIVDITNAKISISYAPDAGVITTDECLYVRFQSVRKGMKQGDGNQMIELPFIAGMINYNV